MEAEPNACWVSERRQKAPRWSVAPSPCRAPNTSPLQESTKQTRGSSRRRQSQQPPEPRPPVNLAQAETSPLRYDVHAAYTGVVASSLRLRELMDQQETSQQHQQHSPLQPNSASRAQRHLPGTSSSHLALLARALTEPPAPEDQSQQAKGCAGLDPGAAAGTSAGPGVAPGKAPGARAPARRLSAPRGRGGADQLAAEDGDEVDLDQLDACIAAGSAHIEVLVARPLSNAARLGGSAANGGSPGGAAGAGDVGGPAAGSFTPPPSVAGPGDARGRQAPGSGLGSQCRITRGSPLNLLAAVNAVQSASKAGRAAGASAAAAAGLAAGAGQGNGALARDSAAAPPSRSPLPPLCRRFATAAANGSDRDDSPRRRINLEGADVQHGGAAAEKASGNHLVLGSSPACGEGGSAADSPTNTLGSLGSMTIAQLAALHGSKAQAGALPAAGNRQSQPEPPPAIQRASACGVALGEDAALAAAGAVQLSTGEEEEGAPSPESEEQPEREARRAAAKGGVVARGLAAGKAQEGCAAVIGGRASRRLKPGGGDGSRAGALAGGEDAEAPLAARRSVRRAAAAAVQQMQRQQLDQEQTSGAVAMDVDSSPDVPIAKLAGAGRQAALDTPAVGPAGAGHAGLAAEPATESPDVPIGALVATRTKHASPIGVAVAVARLTQAAAAAAALGAAAAAQDKTPTAGGTACRRGLHTGSLETGAAQTPLAAESPDVPIGMLVVQQGQGPQAPAETPDIPIGMLAGLRGSVGQAGPAASPVVPVGRLRQLGGMGSPQAESPDVPIGKLATQPPAGAAPPVRVAAAPAGEPGDQIEVDEAEGGMAEGTTQAGAAAGARPAQKEELQGLDRMAQTAAVSNGASGSGVAPPEEQQHEQQQQPPAKVGLGALWRRPKIGFGRPAVGPKPTRAAACAADPAPGSVAAPQECAKAEVEQQQEPQQPVVGPAQAAVSQGSTAAPPVIVPKAADQQIGAVRDAAAGAPAAAAQGGAAQPPAVGRPAHPEQLCQEVEGASSTASAEEAATQADNSSHRASPVPETHVDSQAAADAAAAEGQVPAPAGKPGLGALWKRPRLGFARGPSPSRQQAAAAASAPSQVVADLKAQERSSGVEVQQAKAELDMQADRGSPADHVDAVAEPLRPPAAEAETWSDSCLAAAAAASESAAEQQAGADAAAPVLQQAEEPGSAQMEAPAVVEAAAVAFAAGSCTDGGCEVGAEAAAPASQESQPPAPVGKVGLGALWRRPKVGFGRPPASTAARQQAAAAAVVAAAGAAGMLAAAQVPPESQTAEQEVTSTQQTEPQQQQEVTAAWGPSPQGVTEATDPMAVDVVQLPEPKEQQVSSGAAPAQETSIAAVVDGGAADGGPMPAVAAVAVPAAAGPDAATSPEAIAVVGDPADSHALRARKRSRESDAGRGAAGVPRARPFRRPLQPRASLGADGTPAAAAEDVLASQGSSQQAEGPRPMDISPAAAQQHSIAPPAPVTSPPGPIPSMVSPNAPSRMTPTRPHARPPLPNSPALGPLGSPSAAPGRPPRSPSDPHRLTPSPRLGSPSFRAPGSGPGSATGGAAHRLRDPSKFPAAIAGITSPTSTSPAAALAVQHPPVLSPTMARATCGSPAQLLHHSRQAPATAIGCATAMAAVTGLEFLPQLAPIKTRFDFAAMAAAAAAGGGPPPAAASLLPELDAGLTRPPTAGRAAGEAAPAAVPATGSSASVRSPVDIVCALLTIPGAGDASCKGPITSPPTAASAMLPKAVAAPDAGLLASPTHMEVHVDRPRSPVSGTATSSLGPPAAQAASEPGQENPPSAGPKPLRGGLLGLQPFFSAPGFRLEPAAEARVTAAPAGEVRQQQERPVACPLALVCEERLDLAGVLAAGRAVSPLPPRPRSAGLYGSPGNARGGAPGVPSPARGSPANGGNANPAANGAPAPGPAGSLSPNFASPPLLRGRAANAAADSYSTPPFTTRSQRPPQHHQGSSHWLYGNAAPFPSHQCDSLIEDVVSQLLNEDSPVPGSPVQQSGAPPAAAGPGAGEGASASMRMEGLPVGSPLPPSAAQDQDGNARRHVRSPPQGSDCVTGVHTSTKGAAQAAAAASSGKVGIGGVEGDENHHPGGAGLGVGVPGLQGPFQAVPLEGFCQAPAPAPRWSPPGAQLLPLAPVLPTLESLTSPARVAASRTAEAGESSQPPSPPSPPRRRSIYLQSDSPLHREASGSNKRRRSDQEDGDGDRVAEGQQGVAEGAEGARSSDDDGPGERAGFGHGQESSPGGRSLPHRRKRKVPRMSPPPWDLAAVTEAPETDDGGGVGEGGHVGSGPDPMAVDGLSAEGAAAAAAAAEGKSVGGRGGMAAGGGRSLFAGPAGRQPLPSFASPGGSNWIKPGLAWTRAAGGLGPSRPSPPSSFAGAGGPSSRGALTAALAAALQPPGSRPTGPHRPGLGLAGGVPGAPGRPLQGAGLAMAAAIASQGAVAAGGGGMGAGGRGLDEPLMDVPRITVAPRGSGAKRSALGAADVYAPGRGPEVRNTLEQEYREALINARLAQAWAAGERWARCDLYGLPAESVQRGVAERMATLDIAASKLNCYRGAEGAQKVIGKVEEEWEHLKRIRVAAATRTSVRSPSPLGANGAAAGGAWATPPPASLAANGSGGAGAGRGPPDTPMPFAAHVQAAALGSAAAAHRLQQQQKAAAAGAAAAVGEAGAGSGAGEGHQQAGAADAANGLAPSCTPEPLVKTAVQQQEGQEGRQGDGEESATPQPGGGGGATSAAGGGGPDSQPDAQGPSSVMSVHRAARVELTPPPSSILKTAPTPTPSRGGGEAPASGGVGTGARKGVKFAATLELGPQAGYSCSQAAETQPAALPPSPMAAMAVGSQ